jgi:hypothetical protein
MRTIVKVKQVFRNIKNQMFLIENLFSDLDVDLEKEYSLELKEVKSKRTLQQNKYMWALIHSIAHHESMNQNEVEIYSLALEEANSKYIYLMGTPEAEDELRKNFRAVRVVRPTVENGKEFIVYKCFIGTSKMDTKEMKKVLDIIIAWAEELGIETNEEYYSI